jgi:hypothetical protein
VCGWAGARRRVEIKIKIKNEIIKKCVLGQVPGDVVEIKSGHRVPGAWEWGRDCVVCVCVAEASMWR